jgi:predicted porin
MRKRVWGATLVAAGMVFHALPASADDKLDDVLKRLDKIEKRDAALANENAALRKQLNKRDAAAIKNSTPAKPGATLPNATVLTATRTSTPPPALVAPEIDANGHGFLEHKKGNPLTFYTPGGEITGYGNIDVSFDDTAKEFGGNINNNPNTTGGSEPTPLGNMGFMPAISTNSSYLGVRGFQRVPNFPFNFVYQLEVGFDVSSTPGARQSNSNLSDNVNGALFNRNTYIGFASPEFGALKIGKTTAPYERSTGGFNPFAGEIGDMHAIVGNTGGDNRVEFGGRLDHSIWYESPTIGGFQWNFLFSPGQNRSTTDDNVAAGEAGCTGGNDPTSGGLAPTACNDGSFGNAISANLSYTRGPFYATIAYERHYGVNRQSDITAIWGTTSVFGQNGTYNTCNIYTCDLNFASGYERSLFFQDVGDEDAFKVAALYTFSTKTTVGGIFESMHRYLPADLQFQNERQRNDTWFFVTQELTPVDSASFGWAHAFKAVGDPGQHNDLTLVTLDGNATYASNDNNADMLTANYKHKFSSNLTWYTAVASTINGYSAHYDLGAGGHTNTTDAHSAFGATGGLLSVPHLWTGNTLFGVSSGVQWRF